MAFIVDHERSRVEFDWIAVDRSGCLGYFATAGFGPIPSSVASNCDLYDEVLEAVLLMPIRGSADVSPTAKGDVSEWLEVARRGMFAYDWCVSRSCYELVARPSVPDVLGGALREIAKRTRLSVTFASLGTCLTLTS
jgi:hypothetical protein